MKHRQIPLVLFSLLWLPLNVHAQVTLRPWVEVFGTTNGQQPGKYVTGITPSATLPYKAAVSKVGSTGIYQLQDSTQTNPQRIFVGENLLTGDLNNDGFTDIVLGKTVTGIDTLNPLKIPGENQYDGLKPGCIGDLNGDSRGDLVLRAPHYDRIYYVATFRMKITKVTGQPTATVAVLSLYCPTHGNLGTPRVLRDSSFALSDTYYEFKVPFSLEVGCDPPCEEGPAYLTGGASGRPNHIVCTNVDIRVWWAGHRTTWLDFVIVEDIESEALFAGTHNQVIREEIDDFDALGNVQRTYLQDEPQIPGWLAHEYMKRFIRDSVLTTNKPTITASPWTDNWVRRFNHVSTQPDTIIHLPDQTIYFYDKDISRLKSLGIIP